MNILARRTEHQRYLLRERKTVHWETFAEHVQGWFEATAYPTADGGLAVYYRDIGERKQAELRLQEGRVPPNKPE